MSTKLTQGNINKLSENNNNQCPQLPGSILRVFIPAGAVINLLNLIEITSPSGICLIIRVPVLGGSGFEGIAEAIKNAGGTIEIAK